MKKKSWIDFINPLVKKRKKIDRIDRKLLSLLNQRLRLALKAGKIKKEMGKKIYDPKREKEVLKNLKIKNKGPLKNNDLEKIFKAIIGVCRKSSQDKEFYKR